MTTSLEEVRLAVLRNVTLEPALPAAIQVTAARAGLNANVFLGDFDCVERLAFDATSALYAFRPDIVIVALYLQAMAPQLVANFAALQRDDAVALAKAVVDRVVAVSRAVRQQSSSTILVHNFENAVYPAYGILDAGMPDGQRRTIARMNECLAEDLRTMTGTYVIDVDRMVSEVGYERAIDQRYWHIARAPYTLPVLEKAAREYVAFAAALKGEAKKCLVLDCDNTLWGGVVGEEGLAGIALGASSPGSAFVAMHAAVLNLYHRGVLLALASKNDDAAVVEVFATHPSSLLKPEHFVAKRVNWQDKATNLREIARELNIGLDALVFVDDNPFECNLVRDSLPEVTVIDLPEDPSRFADLIRSLQYFDTLGLSAEDRRRSQMYRASASREALRAESGTIAAYLRSLEMKLTVADADAFSMPRIAQLTQKTNQFNLTTRRYSEEDISRMASDSDWHVYHCELVDKFDDSGIIAVALVHDEAPGARVDAFLMSCRVIGRGVETVLMEVIAQECRDRNITWLRAEYLPTLKNELAGSFLKDCGFVMTPEPEGRWWTLDVAASVPSRPDWFTSVVRKVSVLA